MICLLMVFINLLFFFIVLSRVWNLGCIKKVFKLESELLILVVNMGLLIVLCIWEVVLIRIIVMECFCKERVL